MMIDTLISLANLLCEEVSFFLVVKILQIK